VERFDELIRAFDESGYARLLGLRVVELEPGRAKVAVELRPEHLNAAGLIHGGLIASLADHAFGCATNSLGRAYVAAQLGVSFLAAPAVGATIFAEALVLHAGRRAGTAEIAVRDGQGKLLAKALGTVVAVGDAPPGSRR
jgi:acyl-CoA thioesterase